MPAPVRVELRGVLEARAKADQVVRDLSGAPMLTAMRDATMLVTRTARQEAVVDRGLYRASIVPAIETRGAQVVGIVGSNAAHAPYAVLGSRPHWPPMQALVGWARRHGIDVFLVARAIARRGTRGDRSLIIGLERNTNQITSLLARAVTRIVDH